MGNLLASRDTEKVYITDTFSAAGIAGTAGIAIEMVRLFAVELEYYEKIEGVPLTFDGKANKLSKMVRDNLPAAMQGLAAIPLLVGFDDQPRPRPPVASCPTTWSAGAARSGSATPPSARVRCSRSRR